MIFDSERLFRDVTKKRHLLSMSQKEMTDIMDISRTAIWRLQTNKPITMETFLKILSWSDHEVTRYIKRND